jgi:hypothetical protein
MATEKKQSRSSKGNSKSRSSPRQKDNDLFMLLKQDHERVKDLFEQIFEDGEMEGEAQQELFAQIQQELEVHMEGEEKFFYPALEESDDAREKVLEAYEEHHVAKNVLGEFESMDQDDERWRAKLKVLQELVEHHVQEEEKEIFKLTKKALDKEQIQEISEQIQEQKSEMASL